MSIDRIAGGLSTEEAAARLGRDGPNALPAAEAKGFRRIVAEAHRAEQSESGASASTTWARFHARYGGSCQCCSWQPPQRPKC